MIRSVVVLTIIALLVLYLRNRLVRDTRLTGWKKWLALAGIAVIAAPIIIVTILRAGGPPTIAGWLAWPTYIGQALLMLTFGALLVSDIVRLVVWGTRKSMKSPPIDHARREALARITGGVVVTAVAAHVGYGVTRALGDAEVVSVPITLKRLPAAMDGFTIVQLSDVHVGGTIKKDFIEEMVARTNALNPDVIALTGDFVDGSVANLANDISPLGKLRATHGVYFVTGNHEYYAGADAWCAHLTSLGIRVLRNERVTIEKNGAAFDLAGVDDHSAAGHTPGHGMDLAKAVEGRDPSRALVLLAHQPRQVHVAKKHGVDLQLSGHTHGGQVWPWHYIVSIQQGGLLAGRYDLGATQLYVSRGAGYWGPPVRVGAPPEITRVILRAAA